MASIFLYQLSLKKYNNKVKLLNFKLNIIVAPKYEF